MPRPLRLCLENVTYHVFSHCLERRNMIEDDKLKKLFLQIVFNTKQKYNFQVIFYQIMDGSFHLMIKTTIGGVTISRIVQYIKARFAEKYNRLFKRTGPFWNGRFKDTILELCDNPVRTFFLLIWKIAYLPAKERKSKNPRQYPFSSINMFLLEKYKPLLKIYPHKYFEEAGRNFYERMMVFRGFEPIS
jgi:REP element-mobilizing transposase RayT